ncbi:hypothetical protein, partial [Nibrella saemangeumensis]|uniref:hypothetical protein n=1 Tax=Nibrella saemangeumensis TaxID=1084526 RepID=UPI0031EFC40F
VIGPQASVALIADVASVAELPTKVSDTAVVVICGACVSGVYVICRLATAVHPPGPVAVTL